MIIDAQVHVYGANTPACPWHEVPNWPDHVTGEEMVAAMDRVGVDGAIVVSSLSLYRYDAGYVMEAQRSNPDRFAIIKPIDLDDPAADEIVADWKCTPGAVGIRAMLPKEADRDADDPGLDRVLRAAARQGLPVNLLCWGNLDLGAAVLSRNPNTRFVIDHLGIQQPLAPPTPEHPWADLPKVLELAKWPNAVIKITGACTLSQQTYPFRDIWDPLSQIFDAWGLDRCLWGTDWTRTSPILSYEQGVQPFVTTERLTESEREMLMHRACAAVYNWSPGESL